MKLLRMYEHKRAPTVFNLMTSYLNIYYVRYSRCRNRLTITEYRHDLVAWNLYTPTGRTK